MNKSLFKFAASGYLLTFLGVMSFFVICYRGFSELNLVFLAPLLLGVFLLIYKSNALYHRSKKLIILLDFLFVLALILVLAIDIPHFISIILAVLIGVLGGFGLMKFTFKRVR
jgi:hypothetical protein